jgi:CheY-like chemotaxis protein
MAQGAGTLRFIDDAGREWLVHEVERQAGSGARSAYLPESWQRGWLLFETATEKRRLAPVPNDWRSLDLLGLQALLDRAVHARPSRWADRPPRPRIKPVAPAPELGPLAEPSAEPAIEGEPAVASGSARWTVLLVDDDVDDRRRVLRELKTLPIAVVEAGSGQEGLDVARRIVPDLVLLDYRLPDMTGGAVLDQLRADTRTGRVPVLWCSGSDRALDLDPRTRRAVGRINKDRFDPEDLRRQVLGALGERPAE